MALTDWLIDKSALVRLGSSPEHWADRIERGLVRLTRRKRAPNASLSAAFGARSPRNQFDQASIETETVGVP